MFLSVISNGVSLCRYCLEGLNLWEKISLLKHQRDTEQTANKASILFETGAFILNGIQYPISDLTSKRTHPGMMSGARDPNRKPGTKPGVAPRLRREE